MLEEWLLNDMRKHWKLVLLGIVSYLVFLIVLTPASWWLRLVPLPTGLQFGAISGTLWQGQIKQWSYQQRQLPALSWQLNPWSLMTLSATVDVRSGSTQHVNQPYLQGRVKVSFGNVTLQNTIIKLPVANIMPYLQLPLPVQALGELFVEIQQLELDQQQCMKLHGQASWLDASLQPPTGNWLDLKHIHAKLSCEQGQPVLITDPENLLSLAIRATVSPTRNLRVQGTLKPDASLPAEVHQAMRFVGQPDANGRYSLNF